MYWRVVIRLKNDTTIHCRFPNRIAAEVMKRICDRKITQGVYLDSHVVSCKPRYPDPEVSKPEGKYWCPFCGTWRRYWTRNRYQRCEVCWTTTECDAWRKVNVYEVRSLQSKGDAGAVATAKERRRQRRLKRKQRRGV